MLFKPGFAARNELIATSDCVCLGQTFTYTCTVVGGLFTVWRGSAVSPGCEVTLIHSEYLSPGGARSVCNNGAIVGQGVGVENNCYTSMLNVQISQSLVGRTIECNIDDGIHTSLINSSTINITTGMCI